MEVACKAAKGVHPVWDLQNDSIKENQLSHQLTLADFGISWFSWDSEQTLTSVTWTMHTITEVA